MSAAAIERAKAAATAVQGKAKAAFEKLKPKFGERITIAGEPVYLDMPEESKIHTDRIYLGKEYLRGDKITEDIKTIYRDFIKTKKVASCKQEHMEILKRGLLYRLQVIEGEAVALKEHGDSVSLRERLGHSQKLRDLLETVEAEVRLCSDKVEADSRREDEEEVDAVRAALDNRPPPLTEEQIQMLVKKFAILILHAKAPLDEDRGRLNGPAKNLVAKLDSVPDTFVPSKNDNIRKYFGHGKSNPLLSEIFLHGLLGEDGYQNGLKTQFYEELLNEIKQSLQANPELKTFIDRLNAENPQKNPHEQIKLILSEVSRLIDSSNNEKMQLNTRLVELGEQIKLLTNNLKEAEKKLIPPAVDPKLVAEIQQLKGDLAAKTQEFETNKMDLAKKERELRDAKLASEAIKAAARNKEASLNAEVKRLEGELKACKDSIPPLEAAVAAAQAETAVVRGQIATRQAEIDAARAAAAAAASGDQAAAAAAADAARLASEASAAEMAALRQRLATSEAAVLAATADLATANGRISTLETNVQTLTETVAEKQSSYDVLLGEKNKCEADLKIAKEQLAAATVELDRIRAEKEKCQKELEGEDPSGQNGLRAKYSTLELQDKEQKAKIKELNEAVAAAAAKLAAKEREDIVQKEQIAALAKDMATFRQMVEAKRKEFVEAISTLSESLGKSRDETKALAAKLLSETKRIQDEADEKLKLKMAEQERLNNAKLTEASGRVAAAAAALQGVQRQLVELEEQKRGLTGQLSAQTDADKAKNASHAKELDAAAEKLRAAKAEYLSKLANAEKEAEAAAAAAAAASAATIKAASEAHERRVAELNATIVRLQGDVERITKEKDDKIAAAEKAKAEEIDKIQKAAAAEKTRLEAAVAAAGAELRAADERAAAAALKTKTDAEAAAAAHTAALDAAVAAATRKCDEEKEAAKAAATAALGAINRRLDELARESSARDDEHAKALAALKAQYAKDLANAEAAAVAKASADFDERVRALDGTRQEAIDAAVQAARDQAAANLTASLAALRSEKNAAAAGASAADRSAAKRDRDVAVEEMRKQGVAAAEAAAAEAKRLAEADFKVQKATLLADRDAAVNKAVADAKAEQGAEFERAKAGLAAAAAAASLAAVAAAKAEEGKKTASAVAAARVDEEAKTKAADLEILKEFATRVLAGQAKWAAYPGADKNAALGQLLAKMDGRMSDICALVYFVSYFLNKMIRPNLVGIRGNNTTFVQKLVTKIKDIVDGIANTPDRLFELIMTIEPALLLSNKIMPRRDETVNDTMNYVITQKTDTRIFKDLVIASKENIATNIAWQVVRNRKDTEKSMRFIPMENSKQVLFIHRPEVPASDAVQAGIRKKLLRTYSEGGVLSPIPAVDAGALQTVINAAEGSQDFITYDVLFLVFLYASKKYIIDNKDSIPCTVPIEIINNSILKDSMVEGQAQAAAAQAPAAPAARVAPAAPAAPIAAARVAAAPAAPVPAPVKKCTDVIFKATNRLSSAATLITLGENHVNYFKAYPFCFKEENSEMLIKGAFYDYKFFQDQLNNVVGKVCRGEITDSPPIIVQPGFWQDIHVTGAMIPYEKTLKDKIYDLTSLGGEGKIPFNCRERTTQEKMGRWAIQRTDAAPKPVAAPQSAAVTLQVPALLQQAAESRTGAAPARPISPAAQAEANRLVAAAAASSAGQARRVSATSVKANANAAEATARAARAAAEAVGAKEPWATRVQEPRPQPRPSSARSLVSVDSTPAAPPARPAACPVPIPVISAVATPRARTQFTGVVLNSAIATLLKSPPYCLDVEGYASIEAAKKYSIYNMIDLTDKIAQKLPVGQKLPGFDTTPRTIRGKSVASVLINFNNMFPKKAQGYYFLDPPNKTAEQWGGRRTQKKRRQTSKKFTQRKR